MSLYKEIVDGGFLRRLELQVAVVDIPHQQALALQVSARAPAPTASPITQAGIRVRPADTE